MARVTKINVGGTNYDIAHEGELKNSGFEVVTELPTTGLFAGREVMYNGKKYVYSSGWKEEITSNTMYEANLKWGGDNFSDGYSPIDAGLIPALGANRIAFLPPENIDVEYSRDGGNSWLEYNNINKDKLSLTSNYESRLYIGNYIKDNTQPTADYQLRVTINAGTQVYSVIHKLVIRYSTKYSEDVIVSVSASKRNSTYFTELTNCKLTAFPGYSILNFNEIYFGDLGNYYNKLRLTFTNSGSHGDGFLLMGLGLYGGFGWYAPSNLARIGTIYSFDNYGNVTFPASVNSTETVNFDVNNIEPTQTGNVTKTSTWLWQYLVQGVNWLRANNVRLSAYNTKVAALEQADSDNNTSIQSVSTDLTELSNSLAAVATSGSYNDLIDKPTFSGSYNDLTDKPTLFSGSYDDLTDKPNLATVATSGSYNDLTNTPNLATVATSGSYNDLTNRPTQLPNPNALNIMVLDSEGASLGPSIVYDGVAAKYLKLIEGYGITLSNTNLNNSHEVTINLKQIAGTTLLGNASGTTNIPQAVTMEQLRTMLGSLTLNGISVTLGGNSSYTLPCFISYSGTLFQARIENNWLQIYRNGVWANLYYLLSSLPTECRYITDLSDPSWYDESVTEYELDNSATEQLLSADSSTNIANWIEEINANQITFNSSVIPSKDKGALDNIISNLKGNGYSVFVENDIDTILGSGNDWFMSIKIKRFNDTYKAIIECYVAR